ncbi:hypothetical protein AY599_28725 [Leptolyngbya valderiana BDU 20041]|nr:hypothetical protein AY599_28725 [Leptolyngbya valderiana BDU 20041]
MLVLFSILAVLAQPGAQQAPDPAESGPVVVELFTSQGCPLCPDANNLLEELDAYGGVIAIAYGVGWWDVYGWRDEFARPEFAERQTAYVEAGEAMRVFTPHYVINGSPEKMRFSPEAVRAAVVGAEPLDPHIRLADGAVVLDGPARETPARLWRVDYRPGAVSRRIEGGANAGRTMRHFNMATGLAPLGDWAGGEMRIALEPPEDGEACAVLVQDGPGGPIIAAAAIEGG